MKARLDRQDRHSNPGPHLSPDQTGPRPKVSTERARLRNATAAPVIPPRTGAMDMVTGVV